MIVDIFDYTEMQLNNSNVVAYRNMATETKQLYEEYKKGLLQVEKEISLLYGGVSIIYEGLANYFAIATNSHPDDLKHFDLKKQFQNLATHHDTLKKLHSRLYTSTRINVEQIRTVQNETLSIGALNKANSIK